MKKYFLTGLISLLPIALTVVIVLWLFNLFTAPLAGIAESIVLSYEKYLGIAVDPHSSAVFFMGRILAFFLLLFLILFLGYCGQKFLIRYLLRYTDQILSRIPLVRTVYKLSHGITSSMFSENKKTFQQTVLVPFPHEDALAVGFIMGKAPNFSQELSALADVSVFVPTAPHPMSGFVLLMPKKMTLPVNVTVEEAFKFLISCGVVHPGEALPSSKSDQNKH